MTVGSLPDAAASNHDPATEGPVVFLFIGGAHQVGHLAPVAARLSIMRPGTAVECICADEETMEALSEVRERAGADGMLITRMTVPLPGRIAARLSGRRSAVKLPLLARIRVVRRHARAIIVPERTSAILRAMGWRRPLIHFRHGAGDRAPKSERRLARFDLVVVAGEKDVRRAVDVHGIDPERIRTCGYVKLDHLAPEEGVATVRAFDNDRPTVVYNPHFDRSRSSWGLARRVIAHFAAQDHFNLVMAPHVRLSDDMDAAEIAQWASLQVPGRIVIDLRSPRLIDMTHLNGADVYLGDVSSQLYEFLARPRPIVMLDAHGTPWRDDPKYAGWHLGEVSDGIDGLSEALDRAIARHPSVAEAQRRAVLHAFGEFRGAASRGALILCDELGI